jgi:hypothetical protein
MSREKHYFLDRERIVRYKRVMANSPVTYIRLPEGLRKDVRRIAAKESWTLAVALRELLKEAVSARKNGVK